MAYLEIHPIRITFLSRVSKKDDPGSTASTVRGENIMKRSISRLLPIICAGLLVSAGCAKKDLVKQEEPVAPAMAAATVKKADPAIVSTGTTSPPLSNDGQKQSEQGNEQRVALQSMLEKVYFDFDSSTLSPKARQALSKNFELLKQHPQGKILVEGHCDERGSDAYNLALGQRRAQAAVNYLITMGVPTSRLSPISYGKEKPADPGHDDAAWAKNRRDEFIVSP